MKRSYLMRRPVDDDNGGDYDYGEQQLVRAKPIDGRTAQRLGIGGGGKDFVRGSERSQREFRGEQIVVGEEEGGEGSASQKAGNVRPLSHDERNKISASIIKAELRGDKEKVRKLQRKLDEGIVEIAAREGGGEESAESNRSEKEQNCQVLLQMDKRSGLVMPARGSHQQKTLSSEKQKGKGRGGGGGTVDSEFHKDAELAQLIAEEKRTTAEEQITMFNRAAKICSESRVDDDCVVDDNLMSHPKKKRHERKEEGANAGKRISEHKFVEQTLGSCAKCIESRFFEKHAIVATGIKTYLAVVNWDGLSSDHCYIAPMAHYASAVVMDEDVYDEMRLWQKGLVAMWAGDEEEEQDCVFVENAMNLREQQHMCIECIPIPRAVGDMAPIYFKKAIMECEKEWSDNKKLIDLSKSTKSGGVRGAIPRGFPYFAVNFGLQPGYAHVIEDEKAFPSNFAQEIVGGMLDLPHRHWRKPKRQTFDEVREKAHCLRAKWAKYDWTEVVKGELRRSDGKGEEEEEDEAEEKAQTAEQEKESVQQSNQQIDDGGEE